MATPNRNLYSFQSAASQPVYGAMDLGTNNCRMLVVRKTSDGEVEELERFSRIVRLGEGVTLTGQLSEEAMERTMAALSVCVEKFSKYRFSGLRCVTTEACRQAENSASFIERVQRELYLNLEVISHAEEAQLALTGCTPIQDRAAENIMLIDIGGGSTELIWAVAENGQTRIQSWFSVPLGVMGVAELWNDGDDHYAAMLDYAKEKLNASRHAIPADIVQRPSTQVICASGTITTLSAIYLELYRYDRHKIDGMNISAAAISSMVHKLRTMTREQRFSHPCISAERADLILPGCAILEAIMYYWPVTGMTVGDRGVREGIIYSLLND